MPTPLTNQPGSPASADAGSLLGVLAASALVVTTGLFLGALLSAQIKLSLILTIAAGVAIVAIRRPLIGMAAAGVTDLTCYYISGLTKFPPRIYLVSLVCLVSIPKIITLLRNNTFARKVVIILILFAMNRVFVDWIWDIPTGIFLKDTLARQIVPIALFLGCAVHIRKKSDATFLFTVLMMAIGLSGLVAILQFHQIGLAWEIRDLLGSFMKEDLRRSTMEMSMDAASMSDSNRPVGLSLSTIDLSYQLVLAFGFAFPLLVLKAHSKKYRIFLGVFVAILIVAIIESLTRSAIVGAGVIILATLAKRRTRSGNQIARFRTRGLLSIIAILVMAAYFGFKTLDTSSQGDRIYSFVDPTRVSLYLGSFRIIAWHPLGIGSGNSQHIAHKYHADFADLPDPTALMTFAPHNGFITSSVNWGLPALALMTYFFVLLLEYARKIRTEPVNSNELRHFFGQAIPILLAGYLVHASFHNSFPFHGDMVFWYYLGLFVGGSQLPLIPVPAKGPAPSLTSPNTQRTLPPI